MESVRILPKIRGSLLHSTNPPSKQSASAYRRYTTLLSTCASPAPTFTSSSMSSRYSHALSRTSPYAQCSCQRLSTQTATRTSARQLSRYGQSKRQVRQQRRTLISAPEPHAGPIMERRPDRELPDIRDPTRRWLRTLPLFAAACVVSALAIFNYEKSSSSVVAATMYSLRTHPQARGVLGDEVYFRDRFPWIWGELNQVKGRIDIGYGVKGTRGSGFMRFKAIRRSRQALFETVDWTLELEDGTVMHLLDEGGAADPYSKEVQKTA